jgi:hypothetical protein
MQHPKAERSSSSRSRLGRGQFFDSRGVSFWQLTDASLRASRRSVEPDQGPPAGSARHGRCDGRGQPHIRGRCSGPLPRVLWSRNFSPRNQGKNVMRYTLATAAVWLAITVVSPGTFARDNVQQYLEAQMTHQPAPGCIEAHGCQAHYDGCVKTCQAHYNVHDNRLQPCYDGCSSQYSSCDNYAQYKCTH